MKKIIVGILLLVISIYYLGYTNSGLQTIISVAAVFAPGKLHIQQIEGQFAKQIRIRDLAYHDNNHDITIQQAVMTWSPRYLINQEIIIKDLEARDVQIKITNEDKTSPPSNPLNFLKHLVITKASLTNLNLDHNKQSIAIKQVTLDRDNAGVSHLNMDLFDGQISGQFSILRTPNLKWVGELSFKSIQLNKINPDLRGQLSFDLQSQGFLDSSQPHRQQASIKLQHINGQLSQYPVNGDVMMNLQGDALEIKSARLAVGNALLALQGFVNKNWNMQWTIKIPNLKQIAPNLSGSINTSGHIQGKRNNPIIDLNLQARQINSGLYSVDLLESNQSIQLTQPSTIRFKAKRLRYQTTILDELSGNISTQPDQQTLWVNIQMFDGQNNRLSGYIKLPQGLTTFAITQPLQGRLKISLANLELAKLISNELKNPIGHASADLQIDGELNKPKINATVSLAKAGFDLPRFAVKVRDLNVNGIMASPQQLNLKGSFAAGSGHGQLDGNVDFNQFSLTTNITGNRLQTVDSREYQLTVNPRVTFHISPAGMSLTGDINIPKAHLMLNDYYNVVSLPDEVVLTTQKPDQLTLPINLALDLTLTLGDDIIIAVDKFEGRVGGKLNITQISGHPATGLGELHAIKGTYRSYGRTLNISEARLMYSGNALTNPGIYIRAQQKFSTPSIQKGSTSFISDTGLQAAYTGETSITVGVQLTGSIQHPSVSLYSSPSGLSQGDILSYLMFGHPQSQNQGQNAGAVLSALSSVYTSSNSKVSGATERVKSSLALSDLGVDSADIYDPTTNTIVPTTTIGIGKQLGKDLYLRFQIGVLNPVSILNIRYQLSKHFSLQSETSPNENGADLFYTIETD